MSARRATMHWPDIPHVTNGRLHTAWFPKHVEPKDGLTAKCPECPMTFVLVIPRDAPPLPVPVEMAL